jgi:hypothetical protein
MSELGSGPVCHCERGAITRLPPGPLRHPGTVVGSRIIIIIIIIINIIINIIIIHLRVTVVITEPPVRGFQPPRR